MALPHMPTTYTTRKNPHEAIIIRRRNQDEMFRDSWSKTVSYFHDQDIKASKENFWTSNKSFKDSMDAFGQQQEREIRALQLQRRRTKLAEMLQKERDQLEAEMHGVSKHNYIRLKDMKERTEELKSAREEKRQALAEELAYEHFKQNNPDLRRIESDLLKEHVIDKWAVQKEEKEAVLANARDAEQRFLNEYERNRVEAMERMKKKEEERLAEKKALQAVLKDQMNELKERDKESSALNKEEDRLLKERLELDRMEEERKKVDQARKRQEFGKVLLRQHTAQLRRKSKKIQEELEDDLKLLAALAKKEEEQKVILTSRREKAHADAKWMKRVVEDQLKLEKAREAELDMLFQEEAARLWEKREAEWDKERQARERLMHEVFEGRQEQLDLQMDEVRKEQEESLMRREELLREIEVANQLTQRDIEKKEEEKAGRKKELEAQITSRRTEAMTARERLAKELEEEKIAEDVYEEMLRREAEKMKIDGFQPKDHSRKPPRSAWM
ncbi:trichoplein keratin filament-binding protein-like [Lineus longissimus]|uniref:trichoplein keratin filament-binding protein-like n=1 Tax=Lineus longissimus TaxID=88925 RepID=UPI002B4D5196